MSSVPRVMDMSKHRTQIRLENKKRKLEALMNLVRSQEVETDGAGDKSMAEQEETDAEVERQERNRRRKELKNRPRIKLLDSGHKAQINYEGDVQPISLYEIQAIIIACLLPSKDLPFKPTACDVQRSHTASRVTIFLLEEDVPFELEEVESCHFQQSIRFTVEDKWIDKLLLIPVTGGQIRKLQERGLKSSAVKDDEEEESDETRCGAKKTDLLLSSEQMKQENFPRPDEPGFVDSSSRYEEVSENSPMFSLDCEMCRTTTGELEVTRVTLVNENEEVVVETFVKPDHPITDYLTEFSGVTADSLKDVTTRLSDVQEMLQQSLPSDAILIGQSLETDLRKLKIRHPHVIDTSVIFNLSGTRKVKPGLKFLASKFLSQDIQSGYGHCSKEDAVAALRLVQLKLKKGLKFGNAVIDPMRAEWMKGKGHLVPLANFMQVKGVDGKVFYDVIDSSGSHSITVFSSHVHQVKKLILDTVSSSPGNTLDCFHSISVVVTAGGRCYLSCK